MKQVHYTDVKSEIPSEEGIKDVTVRWLISKNDGAAHFAMRLFEVQPNGYTPLHQHDWEHEVFILEGSGITRNKEKEQSLHTGDVIYIPSMEWHQFINTGSEPLKFICVVPIK